MKVSKVMQRVVAGLALAGANAAAQAAPPVRPIGRIERISADSLASVTAVLPMANGNVLVNDTKARRVLLLDSTLSRVRVVADTTSATANAYGGAPGTLIRFHEDSALFIDRSSLSMLVLAPSGAIARVMAIPRPNDGPGLIGGPFGTPGVDSRGRLVYFIGESTNSIMMLGRGARLSGTSGTFPTGVPQYVDSGFIVRVDLATRAVDTVASIATPKQRRLIKVDDGGFITSLETTALPFALTDDWAVLRDGTIAVVRGSDYHVDWFREGGGSSSPKVAFGWQRLDDAHKQTLIDSSAAALRALLDRPMGGIGGGGGRGASGPPRNTGAPVEMVPNIVKRAALGDVPDYLPAFGRGAVLPDADGNLWIRTTAGIAGRPEYDVVNRLGALVDRVAVPSFRAIVGLGPGVVYMAVQDGAGAVRLERARVK